MMSIDFSQYDAVLLDLDGTIYSEDHVLPGAPELVARLAREGRKFACLSNSTLSPEFIQHRLVRMRIHIDAGRIYSAGRAAADYVLERYRPPRRIYNLANDSMQDMLNGDVQWVEKTGEPCDAVVAGTPASVFATLDRQLIALVLLRAGADLIGICPDRIFPCPGGVEFGVGAFCAMLSVAAQVEPTFCGKPHEMFFRKLCAKLGVDERRCVLIGDNLESDIAGAKRVGMSTILTLSGITRREDLDRLAEKDRPDAVIRDLRDLVVGSW